jgi:cytidylate kinase
MDCSVVTVSRALGALGEEVAHSVAGQLGFQYVDDEIITRAAEQAGVSPQTIIQAERTPPLITRILASMANVPPEPPLLTGGALMPLPDYSSEAYRELIGQVIRDTAQRGNAVIVAHGAGIPLAGTPGLLRLFVTASLEVRIARVAIANNLEEREARRAVENSDRERHDFLRRFYGLREELPTHYDLVINTDVLSVEEAASVAVRGAAR